MLGFGLYNRINKQLPGSYCQFFKSKPTNDSSSNKKTIQLFTSNDGEGNITLKITQGHGFGVKNDKEGNLALSTSYGCTLIATMTENYARLEVE